jgi:hypothetical protein
MLPESTTNLLLSGIMGVIGGLFSIPINALFLILTKRDEQYYQHKLDIIAKQRELLLQHKLEMARIGKDDDIEQLKTSITNLEAVIAQLRR